MPAEERPPPARKRSGKPVRVGPAPGAAKEAAEISAIFRGVAIETLEQFARGAAFTELPRRTVICRPGDECNGLHVIVSGRVKLSVALSVGRERVVALLGPGTWFGETALLLGQPHGVIAETIERTVLAHIPALTVHRSLRRDHAFASRMLMEASRRLHASLLEAAAATSSSARMRLIGFLLEAAGSEVAAEEIRIELPARKRDIASHLHITHEHLSRMLRELTDAALIKVEGSHIVVPSVSRLRAEHSSGVGKRGRSESLPGPTG